MTKGAWLGFVVAMQVVSLAGAARAWEVTNVCSNGMPQHMPSLNFSMTLNRCSIPAGSEREGDVFYAASQWNGVAGAFNRFATFFADGGGCGTISNSNGVSEVAYVTREWLGPNRNGVTLQRSRPCALGGSPYEFDVLIAPDVVNGDTGQLSSALTARGVILHEFGHALGASHEDEQMSVMVTATNNFGRIGYREAVYGSSRPQCDSIYPDDVAFMGRWHGDGTGTQRDMFVSGYRFNPTIHAAEKTHTTLTTYTRCPGESVSVTFSHGNKGLAPIAWPNTYSTWIVLSTNEAASRQDIGVDYFSTIANPGEFYTNARTITVPAGTPPGTYWIGIVVDPWEARAEGDEYNNSTILNRKIKVPTGC